MVPVRRPLANGESSESSLRSTSLHLRLEMDMLALGRTSILSSPTSGSSVALCFPLVELLAFGDFFARSFVVLSPRPDDELRLFKEG